MFDRCPSLMLGKRSKYVNQIEIHHMVERIKLVCFQKIQVVIAKANPIVTPLSKLSLTRNRCA